MKMMAAPAITGVVEIEQAEEMVICFENCEDGKKGLDQRVIWLYFAETEATQIVFPEDEFAEYERYEGDEIAKARVFSKNFDFDSSRLIGNLDRLKDLLVIANENPDLPVVIQGHTDSKGSLQYNKKLSFMRAKAVGAWLISNGLSPKRLQYESYGETKPIASNKTKEGREQNRRADLVIRAVLASEPVTPIVEDKFAPKADDSEVK